MIAIFAASELGSCNCSAPLGLIVIGFVAVWLGVHTATAIDRWMERRGGGASGDDDR